MCTCSFLSLSLSGGSHTDTHTHGYTPPPIVAPRYTRQKSVMRCMKRWRASLEWGIWWFLTQGESTSFAQREREREGGREGERERCTHTHAHTHSLSPLTHTLSVCRCRDMPPRQKLAASRFVGIPFTIFVGDRFDADQLEVFPRTENAMHTMTLEDLLGRLQEQ